MLPFPIGGTGNYQLQNPYAEGGYSFGAPSARQQQDRWLDENRQIVNDNMRDRRRDDIFFNSAFGGGGSGGFLENVLGQLAGGIGLGGGGGGGGRGGNRRRSSAERRRDANEQLLYRQASLNDALGRSNGGGETGEFNTGIQATVPTVPTETYGALTAIPQVNVGLPNANATQNAEIARLMSSVMNGSNNRFAANLRNQENQSRAANNFALQNLRSQIGQQLLGLGVGQETNRIGRQNSQQNLMAQFLSQLLGGFM